ncbi:hypothetical protein BHQ18_00700 [Mycolicibacterium flavescens]|uniref:PE-PGRS family protein n=1 Tax=Mycolicibacterium flavescens TaxID=1776 RepID=A0A1E3RQV4_MYCFV|nr:hypothetical protein BHQ18_00700 [Mycolicibacterium flavescens]
MGVAAQPAPAYQLTASIADILQFPALREYIINQITDLATWGVGFAEAGANLTRAIGLLPETLRLLTQQLLSLDLQGALTTIEEALVGTVAAVGLPILDSIITVRERNLAVQLAMQTAVPEAVIGFGAALFGAVDGVLRASIAGGQQVVDAILTLDLGNIVAAFVDATRGFFGSFVEGGQDIVDGIVFVQRTIANALATPPPLVTAGDAELMGFAQRSAAEPGDNAINTASLAGASTDDHGPGAAETPGPGEEDPTAPGSDEDTTTEPAQEEEIEVEDPGDDAPDSELAEQESALQDEVPQDQGRQPVDQQAPPPSAPAAGAGPAAEAPDAEPDDTDTDTDTDTD